MGHEIISGCDRCLDLRSTTSGSPTALENIDAVVDTSRSSNRLSHPDNFKGRVSFIGDAFSPRTLMDAIHGGCNSAYELVSSMR